MVTLLRKVPLLIPIAKWFRAKVVRFAGHQRLKRVRHQVPLKIVIGSGGIHDRDWIRTEIEYLNMLSPEDWQKYFDQNSIDAMLAEHVWEHLTPQQAKDAAKQCLVYLKTGGHLRVAVPDGNHPDQDYIDHVKPGGKGVGADDHKLLYTHDSFAAVFEEAGFQVRMLEYFDTDGQHHSEHWDTADGMIRRSKRFDKRNQGGHLKYTSIILDAIKK